jgi:hypothetical protein
MLRPYRRWLKTSAGTVLLVLLERAFVVVVGILETAAKAFYVAFASSFEEVSVYRCMRGQTYAFDKA